MKKPILPVWRLPRPLRPLPLLLLAALSLAACGQLKKAFMAAPNNWPPSRDHRVRRDGQRLRAYGGSYQSPAQAEQDARESLRRYLLTLDIPGEPPERAKRVQAALRAFPSLPAQAAGKEGSAAVIEVELSALQKLLGTHYD